MVKKDILELLYKMKSIQMKHAERIMYFSIAIILTAIAIPVSWPVFKEGITLIYTPLWGIIIALFKWIIQAREELKSIVERYE